MNSLWNWTDWAREVFGAEQVHEATTRPVVLHFEGPSVNKPWHYLSFHPWRHDYRKTLARTPWADTPIEGRTTAARFISLLPKKWRHRAYFELGRLERRLTTSG
jgi:lipopolysaccharide biosynthesis glycosyltransferase